MIDLSYGGALSTVYWLPQFFLDKMNCQKRNNMETWETATSNIEHSVFINDGNNTLLYIKYRSRTKEYNKSIDDVNISYCVWSSWSSSSSSQPVYP